MLAPQGEPESAERFIDREGQGRGEESGSSPEGLSGVGGAECWDSHQSNKGDLSGSWVYSLRKARYKQVYAKSGPVPWEKSEGEIVPLMRRTTQPFRREAPLLQPRRAGREVMVHARKSQQHPVDKSQRQASGWIKYILDMVG